jgi:hypothetical protein
MLGCAAFESERRLASMKLFSRAKAGEAQAEQAAKTWEQSQRYELEHAIGFMDSAFFREHFRNLKSGHYNISTGYRDALLMSEFFGSSEEAFENFQHHITGKTCLDIGPCVASQITGWDVAKTRIAIEPLLEPIEAWQRRTFGSSIYDGFEKHVRSAEDFLDLQVDGAIVCRNMLDHTPRWPFVLSNISSYAMPGCKLLLWTDLDHEGEADAGHYDIGCKPEVFKRLLENLGFRVIREHTAQRNEINWGCFAERLGH